LLTPARACYRALFYQELADLYAKKARELKEKKRHARQAWLKEIREKEKKEIFTDVLTELISPQINLY
jgi:hypothetical protein